MTSTEDSILEAARRYAKNGFVVIPVQTNGTKAPACPSEDICEARANPGDLELVDRLFKGRYVGIAQLQGTYSDNCETIDFDRASTFEPFCDAVEAILPGQIARLTHVKTPRGHHLKYKSDAVEGNLQLAMTDPMPSTNEDGTPKLDENGEQIYKSKAIIETRGTGGYVVAPGSPVECHEDLLPYEHVGGPDHSDLTRITAEQREVLFAVARSFDEREVRPTVEQKAPTSLDRAGSRPGDEYNLSANWEEILEPKGWVCVNQVGPISYWRRPGKDHGVSATTGLVSKGHNELFFCFSSSAYPVEPQVSYNKFSLYALLYHNGDHNAAARHLGRNGYGEEVPATPVLKGVKNAKHPGPPKNGNSKKSRPVPPPLPKVVLPGRARRIVDCARDLGKLIGKREEIFIRGDSLCHIKPGPEGVELKEIASHAWGGEFEKVADLTRVVEKKGVLLRVPAICSMSAALSMVMLRDFQQHIPTIKIISPVPLLIEDENGELKTLTGYDARTAVYAVGEPPPVMGLRESVELLKSVLKDYLFATPGDYSRALAALITPMLTMGGHLGGRAPLDFSEADSSQTGKGFRNKQTAAIYGSLVATAAQNESGRGVGGVDEAFDAMVARGNAFISLDNIRGKIRSTKIESFLTEDCYIARAAWIKNTLVDPRRYFIMATSNGAELTRDLANRCSCVKIVKQPEGYQFQQYPEGEILEHIQAHQPTFLGAVMAVVREWHRRGKPKTEESRHSFRAWCQKLDWIVQHIFGESPIMAGHQDTQLRMTSPSLSWLREVAIAIIKRDDLVGVSLRPSGMVDVLRESGIEVPGVRETDDLDDDTTRRKAFQAIGNRLKPCFNNAIDGLIEIDGISIERSEIVGLDRKTAKVYTFERRVRLSDSQQAQPQTQTVNFRASANGDSESGGFAPDSASEAAPVVASDETRVALVAPTSREQIESKNKTSARVKKETIATASGAPGVDHNGEVVI